MTQRLSARRIRTRFKRRFVSISNENYSSQATIKSQNTSNDNVKYTALIVNSSASMAKDITLAITQRMPNSSLIYSPGVEVAKWILKKREIHLLVSSSELPDGTISALIPTCNELENPPDLMVVGELDAYSATDLATAGYLFSSMRLFGAEEEKEKFNVEDQVKKIGADIRNDLNNPLQEIVAMIFVAKSSHEVSPATLEALDAIDKATKGMANTVKSLEDKIRNEIILAGNE